MWVWKNREYNGMQSNIYVALSYELLGKNNKSIGRKSK